MDFQAHINKQIAQHEATIANATIPLKEARELSEKFTATLNEVMENKDKPSDEVKALMNDPKTYEANMYTNALDSIERLKHTLEQDLIHCPKRWLVTDKKGLVSPAGFGFEERVFLAGKINIHMDEKPTSDNVPDCNLKLYVYDIEKIIKS
jgi:hypothetical protein